MIKFFKLCLSPFIFLSFFSSGATGNRPIQVGSSPVVSSVGIYIAMDKGYFKDEGLDVNVTDFKNSGAPMTLLLAKGELDVGAGNLTSGLFNAMTEGQQFKLVADKGHLALDRDYIGLLVREDHLANGRYKNFGDLKGFKMGLTALDGVSQQIIAERFLEKAGLAAKDVTFVKLSYAEMNVALRTKQIDACIQLEPFLTQAEKDGIGKRVAGGVEVHPRQQSGAIFFSPNFISERPADGIKFMKAYLRGVRLYNKSIENKSFDKDLLASLKKHIPVDQDSLWNEMRPVGLNNNGLLDLTSLQQDLEWYRNKKYLTKNLKVEEIVDLKFANQATTLLDNATN